MILSKLTVVSCVKFYGGSNKDTIIIWDLSDTLMSLELEKHDMGS